MTRGYLCPFCRPLADSRSSRKELHCEHCEGNLLVVCPRCSCKDCTDPGATARMEAVAEWVLTCMGRVNQDARQR
jgi:hypothetical protein